MSKLLKIKSNTTSKYISVNVNKYAVEYNKIWGSTMTNMEGSTRSTLIGISPVIKATSDLMNQLEAKEIGNLLNQGYMNVQFYDTLSGTTQDEPYTASDISIEMIRENNKWYEAISFTLNPVDIQGVIS